MIEVFVSIMQNQSVLQDERGQPHVIGRNGCSLLPELSEDRRVVVSRLIVWKQHDNILLQQEASEDLLVVGFATPVREACPQLGEHHEGKDDRVRGLENLLRLGNPVAEVN